MGRWTGKSPHTVLPPAGIGRQAPAQTALRTHLPARHPSCSLAQPSHALCAPCGLLPAATHHLGSTGVLSACLLQPAGRHRSYASPCLPPTHLCGVRKAVLLVLLPPLQLGLVRGEQLQVGVRYDGHWRGALREMSSARFALKKEKKRLRE